MEGHGHGWMGLKMLIFGVILILVTLFTTWNVWLVIGILLVIKAIIMLIMGAACKGKKKR
jgi:uncharacterized membrane protein HdeD (DUF308 family)